MIKKTRILFLDLLRIFAVVMMVQGHTFDALLSETYRTPESLLFNIWFNLRGFTAPLFIFTAGAVFAYLLFDENFNLNKTRLKKGIKRAFLLIVLGYFLRYPTYKIFFFDGVSSSQWETFFAVDALHLIGFGLSAVGMLSILSSKFKFNPALVFSFFAVLLFSLSPFVNNINWISFLPLPLAAYLTRDYGSLFPLFPWLGYIFTGAAIGSYLSRKPLIIKTKVFIIYSGVISISLYGMSFFINNILYNSFIYIEGYSLILSRLSFIFLLVSFFMLFSSGKKQLPFSLNLIATNSLWIYVFHLIAVYGWVFSPGLSKFYFQSLNFTETLILFLTIFTIIFAVIYKIEKFKRKKRSDILIAEV